MAIHTENQCHCWFPIDAIWLAVILIKLLVAAVFTAARHDDKTIGQFEGVVGLLR